jgi:hypothetical protein
MRIVRGFTVWFVTSISVASGATLVGVNFGPTGATSPANWTLVTTTPTTINNLMDTTGAATSISVAVASPTVPNMASMGPPMASTIPSDAPTLINLASNFNSINAGPGDTLSVQFSGLTANGVYNVYAIGLRYSGGINQTVTITGAGTPVVLGQIGPADSLFFNGSVGSSSQTLESYAQPITASGTGTIAFQFTSGGRFTVAGVALTSTPAFPPTPAPGSLLLVLVGLAAGGLAVTYARRRHPKRLHSPV